ncbi:MAG: tetratricopeptide repeat protein [Myxococcota bacterium]
MDRRSLKAAAREGRVREVLDALREAGASPSEQRYLRELLRRAVERADPGSLAADDRPRLEALGWPSRAIELLTGDPPPSAVHVPLVALDEQRGFCRCMIASYDPSGLRSYREQYDAASRAAAEDGLRAAALALGRPPLEGYTFLPVLPGALRGVRISGESIGAAAAVSAASLWSGRWVREGTAVTGRVAGDRVASVGGLEAKVDALVHRPDIRRLVVPAEDEALVRALAEARGIEGEVWGARTVTELLDAALEPEPRPEVHPDRAVEEAQAAYGRGWQGWQWPALLDWFERLALRIPSRRPDLQVRVFAMLGAIHRNLGDPAEGLEMLEEALAILQTEEGEISVPHDARTFLYRHLAVTLRALCRFDEALEAARKAEAQAREGHLRRDLAFALGTRGLVHLSLDQNDDAIACQSAALKHLLRIDPAYAPRTRAYLIQAFGFAGRTEEAMAQFEAGMRQLRSSPDPVRRRTDEQWLRTRLAGALRGAAHAPTVRDVLAAPSVQAALEAQPLPGLLARRWLGLALVDIGERARGYALLAESTTAHPQAQEPHVRFIAHLNVLHEGRARAMHGDLDRDATSRMRHALSHLPQSPQAAAHLAPFASEVLAALAARSRTCDALVEALDRFLHACERLA